MRSYKEEMAFTVGELRKKDAGCSEEVDWKNCALCLYSYKDPTNIATILTLQNDKTNEGGLQSNKFSCGQWPRVAFVMHRSSASREHARFQLGCRLVSIYENGWTSGSGSMRVGEKQRKLSVKYKINDLM